MRRDSVNAIRVLVIEDNPGDVELVQLHLEEIGWANLTVSHCALFEQALERLRAERFAAILLDLSLPDADGPETITRVREVAPDAALVVLTGRDDVATELDAVRVGAQEYLHKGRLTRETLSRALHHAIERERLASQIRALVLGHVDATVVISLDGVVRFINDAAERLFGRPKSEVLGTPFPFPLDRSAAEELEHVQGGETRWLEMRVTDIEWMDERARLASLRDVTDRRRAAELRARLVHADRLASIGQLAAGVAHEINNPATFVAANLGLMAEELAAEPGVPAKLDEWRTMVRESLDGMARIVKIVRDLRTFARIEQDDFELLDVNELVDTACNLTANEIRHRARLVKDLATLPRIGVDRAKLTQVLTNLLVNAAQSIESGGADRNHVKVSSRCDGTSVFVSVEDTGSGMSEDVRRRVFEPFFTTKERETGTGLGLSLSAEIIRQHGGEISVETAQGLGTTFTISLPAVTRSAASPSAPSKPVLPPASRRGRILVIDDERDLLAAFRRVLQLHDVVTATGGEEALGLLARDRGFDVILCDLMMPSVDGPTIYEAIRSTAPELLGRFVFCSGGAFTSRARDFLASVTNPCLDKPIEPATLRGVVARMLTASSRERAGSVP